ncbi:MAG: hypothetical protein KA797_08845 [Chitinophagales bacterium]|nr:hypothetical protein [Chitinophagales bacterium]
MQFSQVIGQSSIKENLIRIVQEDKIHHANMLSGKMGYGTLALALAFAQYILCENKGEADSCGTCASCVKVKKMAHPDLHFVYPTFESKELSTSIIGKWREMNEAYQGYFEIADWVNFNKAKNFKIRNEDCEQVIRNFLLKSFEGNYKIQIIWMAELMGKESNKLLKIFEEPPPKSIFILVVENMEELLPTIISRCQIIKIPHLSHEELTAELTKIYPSKPAEIQRIVPIAEGDLLLAKASIEESNFNIEAAVYKWLKFVVTAAHKKDLATISGLMRFNDGIAGSGKEEQKTFLHYLLHFLRESLVMKYSNNCNLAQDLRKVAEYFAGNVEVDQIAEIQTYIDTALYEIERNGSSKMIFINLGIKSSRVFNRGVFELDFA